MSDESKAVLQRLCVGLRTRVARTLVAVLVGSLFVPVAQMSIPALQEKAEAASGSLAVTSNGSTDSPCGTGNNALGLTLPQSKGVPNNNAYTIEAWVKIDGATNSGRPCAELAFGSGSLWNKRDQWNQRMGSNTASRGSYYGYSNANLFIRCGTSEGDAEDTCKPVDISVGTWTHIALQKSTDHMTVYIGGKQVVSRSVTSPSTLKSSTLMEYIKIGPFGTSDTGKVFFGQIRVTKGALYSRNATSGSQMFTPSKDFSTSAGEAVLALFKPQDNSTLATLTDLTGNGTTVTVQNTNATAASTDFPVDPPAISSLSVTTGPLAGGQASVLTGISLTGTTSITVGGSSATGLNVLSDTSVAFTTPSSGTTGAKDVIVTAPGGSATLTGGYTYLPAPTITSLEVTRGSKEGGYANRLTGTNLTGTSELKVGGVAATFTVENSTSIAFTTPSSSIAGAVNVFVKSNSGQATRTNGFTYLDSALNPTFGVETRTANGFQLQISNYNSAYTWSGTSSVQGGSTTVNGTGLITVTGINPATASTVTVRTTRAGYETGTATSLSISSLTGQALVPTFGVETRTSNGFQLQISNYNSAYTWSGTSSVQGGTPTINGTGLITVTGLNPGTASTVTVQTTRTGYETGTATSLSISSLTGQALAPTFGVETRTATGFQLQISNYNSAYSWDGTSSAQGATVTINGTGLITVTGIDPGTTSTVTIQTTRTGYETGTATSSSISSILGSALNPTFGVETRTATGFELQIDNYNSAYTWSGTSSVQGGSVTINGTGLITVSGINPGTTSTVTIQTTRIGYETGTSTSLSISSVVGDAKTPTFGPATSTADGFTLPITNYETSTTWSVSNSLGKTTTISATGLITVAGVNPGTVSTVTVIATRSGYETGTATSSPYSSLTGSQKVPQFGTATSTLDGFTLQITNYETLTSWSVTNSLGKPATINTGTGLITVTGMSSGTSSTVTVGTSRAGYETGTATSSSIFSATAASLPQAVSASVAPRSSKVTWNAPSSTGGLAITDYIVEYSSTGGQTWTAFSHAPSTATELTITGLLDGTAYLYRVAAVNAAGQSSFATSSAVTTSYFVSCSVSGSFYVSGQSIPQKAGQNCQGIATIPQGITQVLSHAFAKGTGGSSFDTNRALTGLIFPASGFTSIDQGGFRNLGLTSVTIPASVTIVGKAAFQNNPLTSVFVTGGSGGASTVLYEGAFSNQNYGLTTAIALTLGSGKIEINFGFGVGTTFSTVDFGTGLRSIDQGAFRNNGIAPGWIPFFPSTITTIGSEAFRYNPNLTTIRFGSETTTLITSIHEYAFDKNYLKSVQYCGPTGGANALSRYLRDHQTNATIWCNFVAPNAPTISTSSTTTQQVSIGWTRGATLNEPPTDTFTIQYKSGSGTWVTVPYETTTPLSSTIGSLVNGTTYTFRVAANNIAGSSAFSNEVQVTPLALALTPQLDTSTATADGFTFNVINYNSNYTLSGEVTAGSGTVTFGTPVGLILPVTVSGMGPGATSSIRVSTTRTNYETGTAPTAGTSLYALLTPTFGTASVTTNGYTVPITNYNSNYTWTVLTSSGFAAIVNDQLIVTGASFSTLVTETITATRIGYAPGSATFSATSLAGLTATYFGNTNTGGAVPSDTSTYQTNATFVILGNSGALSKPGYSFAGWKDNLGVAYQPGATYSLANAGVSFYAQWTANPYRVFYNLTEATAGSVPTDATIYAITDIANVRGNPGNLQRTGYVFAGWADNANRTGQIYVSGDTYTVATSDINFWAAWTPNTYTITYDVNGATGAPSKVSDSYTVGSAVARLALVGSMAKSGYNFGGWATQAAGTALSDSFTVAANTTLFAQWNIASFILTYNLDGGTGVVDSPTAVNYLQQFNLAPATGFTKTIGVDSYAFVAWSANSATYNPGQSYFMPAADLTFTAIWTRIYNVTYSFSGGSVANAIADQQKIALETITVTSIVPTRTGYIFIGWLDQSGESATAGATYIVRDGHYLLYAQWQAVAYSVTYDASSGLNAPTESSKTIGQSFAVGTAPSREFYIFNGWFDGTSTYYPGATYLTGSVNIVFTAQWQAKVFTVSYDLNGGAGSAGGNYSHTYGTAAYLLPTTGFARTDYNFGGWSTSPGDASVGATFAPSSDISLYAIWNIAIYRLIFDGQSGVSESATAKVTIGQSIVLPNATRANHTLQGWSSQQSGGVITAGAASFTPTSDVTLFAQWALQVFTVTYNANGGTSATSSAPFTYGSTTPLILPRPTRANYVFDNWYSSATGGFLIGAADASFTPTTSVTIYAQWIQASLEGLGQATKIAEVTVLAGSNTSFSAGSQGSTATVEYTADSLPHGTVITAYVQNTTNRASSIIDPDYSYVLSIVVAWVAPNGTVPDTADGKPIVVTITNSAITKGSRIYKLVGTTTRVLGTATEDGRVQALLTQDPLVTVAITEPDSPTAILSVPIDATSALISWQAPEVTGGAPISQYLATSSGGQSCTSATTSCTITGLTAGTTYTFTVVAQNRIGASNQSARTASITTAAPPTIPNENTNNSGNTVNPAPAAISAPAPAPVDNSAEVKAAQEKAAAEAKAAEEKAAAELQIAQEKAAAEVKAAEEKAAAELKIAQEEAAAEAKAAEENAQRLAIEDAAKAAGAIVPAVTVYSITNELTLSDYDLAYLRAYLATLKPRAMLTCIGYTYTAITTQARAAALASKQATALCAIIKKERPTLSTSTLIRPAESAPPAAAGSQWVAVSYRVDSYQPITPTTRYQAIQTGLPFLAYMPSYTAALVLKKIEITQCATNKNPSLSATYGSTKKSITITEYSATQSCSFVKTIPKNAKRTIVVKTGGSKRPGARISIVTVGLSSIEIKKLTAGLIRVPLQ